MAFAVVSCAHAFQMADGNFCICCECCSSGGVRLGPVVILVEARNDAEVSAALRTVILGFTAQNATAFVHSVPAEVTAERRSWNQPKYCHSILSRRG